MATNARSLIAALGEPMRVTILERLIDAPSTATELARDLPVTRSAISQHLQVMKSAGLVDDQPRGTRRVYTVDPGALALLRGYFDSFWNRSLENFRRTTETDAQTRGDSVTTPANPTAVSTEIDVEAGAEHAFRVFTEGIGTWWDEGHHILPAPLAEMIFEPYVGGHIIDRGTDGSECRWARILAYEPPARVCFSWDINLQWQIEPDPARTSEVEITFTELSPGRTRVVLTHRHLDRHGDGWEGMRNAVGSGWNLTGFAQAARQPLETRVAPPGR